MASIKLFASDQVRGIAIFLALCVLIGAAGAASAFADEEEAAPVPGVSEVAEAPVGPETNPQAAEEVPHKGLNREEALLLLESVFPSALEGAPSSLEGLQVEEFYSNHLALVTPDESKAGESSEVASNQGQPLLLESLLPLRVENDHGQVEEVDLSLEHDEGELQPVNPLVEVGIPAHLGEPMSFPEVGIEINLPEAPTNLTASTVDDSSAFFPNVATDSDLTMTPTASGAETLTQLRSPEAPTSETFDLSLPDGAILRESSDGGAEVVRGEDKLLSILPPSAYDADGTPVPASLKVDGNSVVVDVTPDQDTTYPVLVDPAIHQWWNWYSEVTTKGIGTDWVGSSTTELFQPTFMGAWGQFGLNIYSHQGTYSGSAWPEGRYTFSVPRYYTDLQDPKVKEVPTTYITKMTFSNLYWWIEESTPYTVNPVLAMGLWDENYKSWAAYGGRWGIQGPLADPNFVYNFENNPAQPERIPDVKQGIALMEGKTDSSQVRPRHLWIGQAEIYYTDNDRPGFGNLSGASKWVNNESSSPITYKATDPGLGVKQLTIRQPIRSGTKDTNTPTGSCVGSPGSPCPRTVESSGVPISVEPASMPQGEDWVKVYAADAISQGSPEDLQKAGIAPSEVKIKVDHTSPELALSGNLTEQAKIGTKLTSYTLNYAAKDGDEAEASALAPIGTAGTGEGQLERLQGLAVDAGGNVWVSDRVNNRLVEFDKSGKFIRQVNAHGSGNGQINEPRGVAVAPNGNIWLAEIGNKRLQEFSSTGAFIAKFTNAALVEPYGVASGPGGTLWVSDPGTRKIFKFKEDGTLLKTIESNPQTNTQIAPFGITVDSFGNMWTVDQLNSKVLELDQNGNFLSSFGSEGSGTGQFKAPAGIAFAPSGNLFVSDEGSRVQEFQPSGNFLRQFGTLGSANNQFKEPRALALGPDKTLYVADAGNRRVDRWTHADKDPQSGTAKVVIKVDGTVVKEEAPGCATKNCTINGSWTLETEKYAVGAHEVTVTATDGVGLTMIEKLNITLNPSPPSLALSGTMTEQEALGHTRPRYILRAEAAPNATPIFVSAFGSTGSGTGQLNGPRGLAADGKGHVWIVDRANNRVEAFNESGEYLSQFGSLGSGNGQFKEPGGIAVTSAGNLWVADTGNRRIEEFNSKGEYIQKFGIKASGESKGTEFLEPEGIAAAPGGMLWVSDGAGHRVAEFRESVSSESERFVRNATGATLLKPMSAAVDASGNVWVADEAASRVFEYRPEGAYLRTIGSTGSGNGQLSSPTGVAISPSGNVYVMDSGNNRVEVFTPGGEFLTKFGASGTGTGQFSEPKAIAFGAGGAIFVTDKGNNRVHKWTQPAPPDPVASIEVKVDGKAVETSSSECTSSNCTLARQWTLNSLQYLGAHSVTVKTTSVSGFTTTKSLSVNEQRDEAKPTIQTGGELANAPEGWVQQEGYGFTATGSDPAGYGVTSLVFKIDGSSVASTTQSCSEGGCEAGLSKTISMAPYSGGSHEAAVTATDGAGNTTTKLWTINVDPEGKITTSEAKATLEAVDATSPVNTVGTSEQEPEYAGTASGLGIEDTEAQLVGTGTAAPVSINPSSSISLTVEVPESEAFEFCQPAEPVEMPSEANEAPVEGEVDEAETQTSCPSTPPVEGEEETLTPITVTPLSTNEGATAASVVNESTAVVSNSSIEVDTAIRPLYDGALIFQAIRGSTAPETYSWTVSLAEDQELKLIDPQHAEVYYSEGHPAFGITAEPAHDAIGTTVPTSLGVSENDVLTLTVNHRPGKYIYPVVAGTGWQGGFTTYAIEMPPNGLPEEDEEETSEESGTTEESGALLVAHVAGIGPPVATASAVEEPSPSKKAFTFEHKFKINECRYNISLTTPPSEPSLPQRREALQKCKQHIKSPGSIHLIAGMAVHGWFDTNQYTGWVWIPKHNLHCDKWGEQQPAMVHCVKRPTSASRTNIHLLGDYRFPPGKGEWFETPQTAACDSIRGRLEIGPTYFQEESIVTPAKAPLGNESGEPCSWP